MAIRRRDDVAPQEFHRYWRVEHGPLACRLLEPLKLRRYVQTHTLETDLNAQLAAARGTVEAFDGVAELWWDSLDDLARRYSAARKGSAPTQRSRRTRRDSSTSSGRPCS